MLKSEIRKYSSQIRKNLKTSFIEFASNQIWHNLYNFNRFQSANTIASYCSQNNEVNTAKINQYILEQKNLCLPSMQTKQMLFAKVNLDTKFELSSFNFKQPLSQQILDLTDIDLVLMPLLNYDKLGTRLGRGGGHYDKALSIKPKPVTTIGLAYSKQLFPKLPYDAWDIKCDYIVTEQQIINCKY